MLRAKPSLKTSLKTVNAVDDDNGDYSYISIAVTSVCSTKLKYKCSVGCLLILLIAANVISAFTDCYPLNGHEYCFYTDGSVLSWDEAREFCATGAPHCRSSQTRTLTTCF